MEKKEPIRYIVEREFLSKFTAEELLIRIIKSHLNKKAQNGSLVLEIHRKRLLFMVKRGIILL